MLHELARDDTPDFDRLMAIHPMRLGGTDRRLIGITGPLSDGDTVGGYCFLTDFPYQMVAARIVRHVQLS